MLELGLPRLRMNRSFLQDLSRAVSRFSRVPVAGYHLQTNNYRTRKRIPFIVLNPASCAVGRDESFLLAAYKKGVFRAEHFTAAASPRLTGHGSPPNLEGVCSTKLRVLAAKFAGRRWSVSPGLA